MVLRGLLLLRDLRVHFLLSFLHTGARAIFAIDDTTAAAALPTPTPAGTAGFFKWNASGNGTRVTPDWLNATMLELLNVVTFTGQTPTKLDGFGNLITDQVLFGIAQLGAFNVNLFSADAQLAPGHAGLVLVDCSAGNVTLTLPLAAGGFWQYEFLRVDTLPNRVATVQVEGGSSDVFVPSVVPATIASFTLLPTYDAVNVRSRGGATWQVLRRNDSPWTFYLAGGVGSFVIPAGYMGIEAEAIGGGGGGGGGNASYAAGGGGAGGYVRSAPRGTLAGATYTYSVGAGGAGGAPGASGSAGGDTTITGGFPNPGGIITLIANGGGGGTFGPAPAGGDGGTSSGADEAYQGGAGGDGYPAGVFTGGNGGASAKGGGGRASTAALAVQTGHAPGSGGGAGYNGPVPGGNGQGGQLRVRFIR